MATEQEKAEALAQTAMLIEREPSEIVITRDTPDTDDGAGGRARGTGTITLEPQTVFLSGVTRDSDYRQSSFFQGEMGESFINSFVVIGMPGLDITQYDTFIYNGHGYEVTFRHPDNGFEVKAEANRITSGGR